VTVPEDDQIQVAHRLTPEGVQKIVRRLVRRGAISSFLLFAVVFTVTNRASTRPSLVVSGTFLALLWIVGCVYTSRRAKKLASSFEVVITAESITRRQPNTPDLTWNRDEIRSIELAPHALLIRSKKKRDLPMVIFRGLENDQDVLARLSEWLPVTRQSNVARQSYAALNWAIYLVFGASTAVALTVTDRKTFLVLGVVVAGVLCWSIWALLNSKTVDRRTRSTAWWMLMPLAALIFKGWVLLARYL
jgi:hypothetical protein